MALFSLKENNTNARTELTAGVTTFFTMAYIIVVNPAVHAAAGVPFEQVFMATIISSIIGTLIMAFFANYPIAVAPGMGLNAYFASVVASQGISYQVVFGAVFLAGAIFALLSFTKFREILISAIPESLKYAITAGIGLFIAFLGFTMSGLIVPGEANIIELGDIREPMTALTIVGLFITLILMARNIKGALFLGMAVTGIIAYFSGQLEFTGWVSAPPTPVFFDLDISGVFKQGLYSILFAFLLVTIFETTGTIIGVAEQGGFMKNGQLPRAKSALFADASATMVGSMFGTSPSSAYIESSAGVAAGGKTGMTTLVVAALFAVSVFFTPIIGAIANVAAITAPVLIIVGCFMMDGLAHIKWRKFDEAFPAFAVIMAMPLTSSIATGIAVGFITYPLLKLVTGKGKEIHWIIYLFAVIFVLQMLYFPAN
ncbi:guanine permease [Siminovitchia terrae]|uniref:Guanine permease n=1 Tax=Siminovitchia terrae TaxID=1914933 RepID=A0A429X161_SIMTE|nr:NCS2 family permease [Siminovitchia terrae]RST57229.1 NCS2 family permease [Siminovitchia terrae]GIN93084.1 guanine permease [Siminovitchia terrae]GIN98819.1 guanine permease [Siminovitchia terrae]